MQMTQSIAVFFPISPKLLIFAVIVAIIWNYTLRIQSLNEVTLLSVSSQSNSAHGFIWLMPKVISFWSSVTLTLM